ncbi:MAG: DUF6153 family protein [Microbacterium sp.]|nr:DUF6153 family protein [Microbacterium sp.]
MPTTTLTRVARPPEFWRWALDVLFAAGVMIGLLGMHTLSVGHGDPAMTTVSAAAAHDQMSMMDEHAAAESGCVDCGSTGGHEALMLACVLGLMATFLLLIRPGIDLFRVRGPSLRMVAFLASVARSPWPPSLHELSISRT